MKQAVTQNLDRTILSRNVENYSDNELRNIFRRLNQYQLQRWMEHFVEKEAYEVCSIIKEVMDDVRI
jgi:hypothetical protein